MCEFILEAFTHRVTCTIDTEVKYLCTTFV